MRHKWLAQGLFALAIGVLSARGASAAVIFNDTFDGENGGAAALNYNGFANFTISNGTVDLIGNGFADFLPGNGLYIDLDGSTADAGIMAKSTTLNLGIGLYKLTFDLAGNQRGGYFPDTVTAQVTGNLGTYQTVNYTPAWNDPFINRTILFYLFVPDPAVYFSFGNSGAVGGGAGDNVGALLDDVKLEFLEGEGPPPVPEPMTLALLGTGIAGVAVRRRRSQA